MDDTGAAMARPTLNAPARRDDAPAASAGPATPAAASPIDAVARAVLALCRLALTLSAADVLRRLSLVGGAADWHLVASPADVAGTWLGLFAPKLAVWAQVDAGSLPVLGMCAVNDPATVAALAHERPWEAHAASLAALREALTAARAEGRMQVRVTLLRPESAPEDAPPTLAIVVSAERLGILLDALEALGDPPRPVWCYLRRGDEDARDGVTVLVLDGGAWLAEIDEDPGRSPLVGRAAAPWPLRLDRVVSTIDPRHVGGWLVPALALEAR